MLLYLDADGFFAAVETWWRGESPGRSLAVLTQAEHGVVIARNGAAKEAGVEKGMRVAEARSACPSLRLVVQRPMRYVEAHHRMVEAVWSVAPVGAVYSIDECMVRLTPGDDPWRMARAARAAVAGAFGGVVTVSVGAAPTVFLAKVLAEAAKPSGVRVATRDALPGALEGVALEDLPGVGPATRRRLRRAGVETVAQLWRLSASATRAVWGSVAGARVWYGLHGVETPAPVVRRRAVSHARVLGPGVDGAGALAVARSLAVRVARRLRAEASAAGTLEVAAQVRAGWRRRAVRGWFVDDRACLRAVTGVWPAAAGEGVRGVEVVASRLAPLASAQTAWWAPARDRDDEALSALCDAVRRRYGRSLLAFGACRDAGDVGPKIAFGRIPSYDEAVR